jgi:hypothetical protein
MGKSLLKGPLREVGCEYHTVNLKLSYQPLSWWRSQDRPLSGWMFAGIVDGDDEPGDPSGLLLIVCGVTIECYWPMHMSFEILFGLEKPWFSLHKW